MIVFAIDPGIEKLGYSVFEKNYTTHKYLASGLIKTDKKLPDGERFNTIFQELKKLLVHYKPHIVILEQIFFFKNQKTAVKISQVQGVILLLAQQMNINTQFLTPLQIKQIITGYGKADKKSVQKMLQLDLKLNQEVKQDDQADAIACGLAYCYISNNYSK